MQCGAINGKLPLIRPRRGLDGSERVDELKLITASNLIKLRTGAGMTQAELGSRLNYSDKTVSKWERAESVPDAFVLKQLAAIFGVSVDYLLSAHAEWEPSPKQGQGKKASFSTGVVTLVSVMGIWTLAVFMFVIFWILGSLQWIIFAAAVPVTVITLLVFNCVWRQGRNNVWIVAALVLSVFLLIYLTLLKFNLWQLFLVLIPAEIIVFLSFRIKRS